MFETCFKHVVKFCLPELHYIIVSRAASFFSAIIGQGGNIKKNKPLSVKDEILKKQRGINQSTARNANRTQKTLLTPSNKAI